MDSLLHPCLLILQEMSNVAAAFSTRGSVVGRDARFNEISAWIDQMIASHSDIAAPFSAGKSYEGRPLKVNQSINRFINQSIDRSLFQSINFQSIQIKFVPAGRYDFSVLALTDKRSPISVSTSVLQTMNRMSIYLDA